MATKKNMRISYPSSEKIYVPGEINKINRILKMLAKEYGFDEVYCSAVFGNGEAVYTKVENTQRARIVRAIKEIA